MAIKLSERYNRKEKHMTRKGVYLTVNLKGELADYIIKLQQEECVNLSAYLRSLIAKDKAEREHK